MSATLLQLDGVSRRFGGVRAVDAVDLSVSRGEILGLIGPNGSGKSTVVNLVCGLFPLSGGRIRFEGGDLGRQPPHARVAAGIARTFQSIRLFGQLTVWQNLWVAQSPPAKRSAATFAARWLGGYRKAREAIGEALEFAGLAGQRDQLAGSLSFGEQRRLELARALATRPKLLLLDEPAAGMNATEIAELDERIRRLRDRGITVVLIEHHMELVMSVTDRIAVLNFGRKIAEGSPGEIQAHREVREAYLGAGGES
jgi:ABC-type branched-subunit amino acid transport system ATPase component